MNFPDIKYLILSLPALLYALTVHEFFHGYAALKMGDPTAKHYGRLTFNPIKHIDIFGFFAFLLFGVGWAKPVPVNPYNFYNYKKGIFYTSIAGPLSNFLSAFLFGLILRIFPNNSNLLWPIEMMFWMGLTFNLVLCIFNLIPIPPLDGSKVLFSILPQRYEHVQFWLERYGFMILIALIFFDQITGIPILGAWIHPFVRFFGRLFAGSFALT